MRLLEKTRPQPDASDDLPDGSYDLWDEYITRWRDALWAQHPDIDAGYLYLEAIANYHCTSDPVLALHCPEDLRMSIERLVRLVPHDPDLLRNAIRIYQEQGMYREAEAGLEKLLELEPLAAKEIREEIGLVRTSIALRDEGERIYAGNGLVLDGNIASLPGEPTIADVPLRAGIAIDYGATLRGSLGGSIGLGAFAQRSFGAADPRGPYSFVEARIDWNQSVASDAGSLSAGLWRHLPALRAASLSLGVDERGEVRFGDPMSGASLATDVSAVLGLYEAPLDLGVRVEQWYAGSNATRALLEIRVRLF